MHIPSATADWRRLWQLVAMPLAVLAVVVAAYLSGVFEPVDTALQATRFGLLPRSPSGSLVLVEIDSRSLHELDTWPWPRGYHAQLLDRLFAAGARDIAFDIDLSARSSDQADAALAATLSRHSRRVILPVFAQSGRLAGGRPGVVETRPAAPFQASARLGSVNVFPDSDGRVRRFATAEPIGGVIVPSSPALLADASGGAAREFYLDFGIRIDELPRFSYVDVLRGHFDPATISGKNVLVGATAIELGDQFVAPLYRTLAGPYLQAIAYESLVQGRALQRGGLLPTVLLIIGMLWIGSVGLATRSWRWALASLVAGWASLYGIALIVQAITPVSLDIAAPAAAGAGLCIIGILQELERQARAAIRHRNADIRRRAMLRGVLEDGFDGIVIAASDGTIEIANSAAARMLGCEREELAGRALDAVFPEAVREQEKACSAPVELQLLRADGTHLSVEHVCSRSQLRETGLRPPQVFIHTFRDITERKRDEARLHAAMHEAQAASRAKSEFLANMSHELRTPLNAIIGFAEIIAGEMLGALPHPRYREYAADIGRSGTHLLDIINDLLDIAKIEAGQLALAQEEVELGEVIRLGLSLVKDRAAKQELHLRSEASDGLPWLTGDRRALRQIALNLLSNAVKFTPAGGTVTAIAAREGDHLVLRVSDTGIGMPREEIANVTKPFYQIDGSLSRRHEGTGLGLALVAAYVALHGGELEIDSVLGAGTTVTVRFPSSRTLTRERMFAAVPAPAA